PSGRGTASGSMARSAAGSWAVPTNKEAVIPWVIRRSSALPSDPSAAHQLTPDRGPVTATLSVGAGASVVTTAVGTIVLGVVISGVGARHAATSSPTSSARARALVNPGIGPGTPSPLPRRP